MFVLNQGVLNLVFECFSWSWIHTDIVIYNHMYIYMYIYRTMYLYIHITWRFHGASFFKKHKHIHNGATSSPLRPPSKQWLLRSPERKEPWECIGLSTLLTSSVSRGGWNTTEKNTKRKRVIWQMLSGEWNVQRFVWGCSFGLQVAIKNVCMFKFPQQKLFFGTAKSSRF